MVVNGVFQDPSWFPDRIDWQAKLLRMIRVDHDTICGSAFLDGRTPLATEPKAVRIVPLRDLIDGIGDEIGDARWIFHESFCGSTLLARALTIDNSALCLREPQVLLDFASWHAAGVTSADRTLYCAALRAIVAKLSQRWSDTALVVIKPSNWANTIAADLRAASAGGRAVAILTTAETFLVAVLRGGRERLRYVLELRNHMAMARPALAAAVADIPASESGTLTSAVSLAAQCFWMQRVILEETIRTRDDQQDMLTIQFPDWLAAPRDNVSRLQRGLGLRLSPATVAHSLARTLPRYSKGDNGVMFDKHAEDAANARVREIYAEPIRAALRSLDHYEMRLSDVEHARIDAA